MTVLRNDLAPWTFGIARTDHRLRTVGEIRTVADDGAPPTELDIARAWLIALIRLRAIGLSGGNALAK